MGIIDYVYNLFLFFTATEPTWNSYGEFNKSSQAGHKGEVDANGSVKDTKRQLIPRFEDSTLQRRIEEFKHNVKPRTQHVSQSKYAQEKVSKHRIGWLQALNETVKATKGKQPEQEPLEQAQPEQQQMEQQQVLPASEAKHKVAKVVGIARKSIKKLPKPVIAAKRSKKLHSEKCVWDDYKYTKLCDLTANMKRVNVWGVIYDVPSGMKFANGNRRICYMTKLVDETTNSARGKQPYVSVTMFFSKNLEYHKKLRQGRIIRIHRAETRVVDGEVRLVCDEYIKASWVLLSVDKRMGDTPLAHDKNTYTWVEEDAVRLNELRSFSRKMREERVANGGAAILPVQALKKDSIWFIAQRGPDAKKSMYYVKSLDQRESHYIYADKTLKQLAKDYNYFIMDGSKISESKNKISILTPLTNAQATIIEHFYNGTSYSLDVNNALPILLKQEDFGKYKKGS